MKSSLLLCLPAVLCLLMHLPRDTVAAERCTFDYWTVIPQSSGCQTFVLPDFQFRQVAHEEDAPEHIKRFCARYEIRSKLGIQHTGYCYTGEGDRFGPTFRLGDEAADAAALKTSAHVYFADLNFQGCVNGRDASGIVFGRRGWAEGPKTITRRWPLQEGAKGKSCSE